jgi:hypothetical protein
MQAKLSSTVLGVEGNVVGVQAAFEETQGNVRVVAVWTLALEWSSRARRHAGRPLRLIKAEAGWIAW